MVSLSWQLKSNPLAGTQKTKLGCLATVRLADWHWAMPMHLEANPKSQQGLHKQAGPGLESESANPVDFSKVQKKGV